MSVVLVIPVRFASVRLPGKPLALIHGKSLIQRVYERALKVPGINRVVIATDDDRIEAASRMFGAEVVRTRSDHLSGTDRVAEVARSLKAETVVNIQGDEPLIEPQTVLCAMEPVLRGGCDMGTVATRFKDASELGDPSQVKVVLDSRGRALMFSRLPIPYGRGEPKPPFISFRHLGVYVYRQETLLKLAALPQTPAERAEGLEQLRALENGVSLGVGIVEHTDSIGVDTPEDLERVRAVIALKEGAAS